jgi:hypothetical protein
MEELGDRVDLNAIASYQPAAWADDVHDLDAAREQVIGTGRPAVASGHRSHSCVGCSGLRRSAGHPFCLCWLPPQVGDRVKLTYPDSSVCAVS